MAGRFTKPCQFCGAPNRLRAGTCEECGEPFREDGRRDLKILALMVVFVILALVLFFVAVNLVLDSQSDRGPSRYEGTPISLPGPVGAVS